jgi:hypothetical protein
MSYNWASDKGAYFRPHIQRVSLYVRTCYHHCQFLLSTESLYLDTAVLNSGTISVCLYTTDCPYGYWSPTLSAYVNRLIVDWLWTDCRLTVDWLLTDCWFVERLTVDCWLLTADCFFGFWFYGFGLGLGFRVQGCDCWLLTADLLTVVCCLGLAF